MKNFRNKSRRGNKFRDRHGLREYYCPRCNGWHLTHQELYG
jgi:hypothetical protein